MKQRIGSVSLLVRDYDEAIEYFSKMLDFRVVEDTAIESEGKRWVVVAPPGSTECFLLLAKPRREDDVAMVGRQAGQRVFPFLHTDDFWRDYRKYLERGVRFCEEPRTEAYGTVVVFEDLYGNRWDLLQQKAPNKAPEPTPGPVTSRADLDFEIGSSRKARLAPGPVVAHL